MKFLSQFVVVVVIVTLVVFVSQSYSIPSIPEDEMAQIHEARIVKRGFFDCPHNCWGNISKLNITLSILGHKL